MQPLTRVLPLEAHACMQPACLCIASWGSCSPACMQPLTFVSPAWAAQIDDQGLINTDPRYIAVPTDYLNMIPTDVRGLTFSRTPEQV